MINSYMHNASIDVSQNLSIYLHRHHQQGRWQARIGRVAGSKDLYLGTYSKFSAAKILIF